ncbi:eukaryotic translation initiation factor 3 subunit G [Tanacetum coccineum]
MALERPGSAYKKPTKLRWGELDDDDGEGLEFLLPPRQVIGPDANGIKKVIEYKFNDDGNKVKVTTTTRVRKLAKARFSKRAIERRGWAKFGDAVHEDVGARLTMVSTEEILLERPRAPGSKVKKKTSAGDPLTHRQRIVLMDMQKPVDSTKGAYVPPRAAGAERLVLLIRRGVSAEAFGFGQHVNKDAAERGIEIIVNKVGIHTSLSAILDIYSINTVH